MFDEIIKKWGGHEVSAMQVYTDLFGLGEGLIQRQDEEPGEFKSNPLGYWKNDGEQRGHRRILFDFEGDAGGGLLNYEWLDIFWEAECSGECKQDVCDDI